MRFWIFIVTGHKLEDETYSPEDILRRRFEDKFWGLGEKTANRRALRQGDSVVFYLGQPHKTFAATASLATDSYELSQEERETLSHGTRFYRTPYGVRLSEVKVWEHRRLVEDLVPSLRFIENKSSPFVYFQGGVRQIPEDDFRAITQAQDAVAKRTSQDIQTEVEFALEGHLEEFIDKNWERIDFGWPLLRYRTDDQDGRQFPAGPWSIDFLCSDRGAGDLVVVELKRGKSSDSTVGQLLRYMSWVKENLAEPGQRVRGIIIARDVDEALRYAVKHLPDVDVLTYRVDFKLSRGDTQYNLH